MVHLISVMALSLEEEKYEMKLDINQLNSKFCNGFDYHKTEVDDIQLDNTNWHKRNDSVKTEYYQL